jgi:Na+/H+ antiporter NhaD/arsenite permease-like protein
MTFPITIATGIIFVLTYAGVSLGRVPGFRLDRAGIALTGAALMMAVGAITPEEAYRAINLDTLALLLGMMIVVAHLRLSGFFRLVTRWALEHAHSPLILLATVAITAGAFSAFLVNDAVCLVMTPLVIEVTRSLRRDPIPYLLAVAMASNVGSTATITGNPQNMIVGAVSRIPYVECSDVNTNGDRSCSRWSRRNARSSSPRIGWVLGVPALTRRTCRVAVLKST